ncbi:hypothetical protein, partial [Frankia sp. Cas4]|uniref:hypothetical protein n=1 Tax=Frankia sp. Cas4 TaxID=3073927 RepID=UPI002AD1D3C3
MLIQMATKSSGEGRHDEAAIVAEDAVRIFRRLRETVENEEVISDLAASLVNFAAFLSNVNRLDEAHSASGEAVQILRSISAAGDDKLLLDLAVALTSHSYHLAGIARLE